jgi:hypothetical protein
MSFLHRHLKSITVAAGCTALGAGASAIASAGAATGTSAGPAAHRAAGRHRGAPATMLARAVHGDVVVATRSGFATATFDRGFVQSVCGRQLTIREGTKAHTYKTVTLSIPANARVRDNGRQASLGALSTGQRVLVWQGPKRTRVSARTPRHP